MEHGARLSLLTVVVAILVVVTPALGRVYTTRAEALVQVFGASAHLEPRTAYFTDAEIESVRTHARAPFVSPRVTYWVATRGDTVIGRGFLDTFTVRTMPATLLVAVQPDGRVLDVELLAFHEPEDYRPPPRWLARFQHRELSSHLRPGDGVDGITGATISARTFTASVRRCLALARIVDGRLL
jgi:hypothetical protein